jgi:hypothetical protein
MGFGDDWPTLYGPLVHNGCRIITILIKIVPNTAAWWDASSHEGLLSPGDAPAAVWDGLERH